MNDRAPIRDRTLVLRILVPRLDQRLREKMKEVEEAAAAQQKNNGGGGNKPGGGSTVDSYFDLEGVSCEPTGDRNRTLWNFHCDGCTYPAQLVNLPCPVEVHKTLDHASYYKAADVAQMLIVYEDALSFDEAQQEKPIEGFPSYYHSGLTPPMKGVVSKRFNRCYAARDRKALPPPRAAVADVEERLLELMEKLQKDEKGSGSGASTSKRSNKLPVLTSATKDLVEIEEEVVDYEEWMDDKGRQPHGIEFDAEDSLARVHPEIWLSAETISSIKEEIRAAEQAAAEKAAAKAAAAAAAAAPPTKKKKKKKGASRAAAEEAEASGPKPKKGIPSRKNATPVDELTQAAMGALNGEDLMSDVLGTDDLFSDLGLDFDL